MTQIIEPFRAVDGEMGIPPWLTSLEIDNPQAVASVSLVVAMGLLAGLILHWSWRSRRSARLLLLCAAAATVAFMGALVGLYLPFLRMFGWIE